MTSSSLITTSSNMLCGISGKAGNIKGADAGGRQSVRRLRAQREYPTPPLKQGFGAGRCSPKAARKTRPASVSAAVRQISRRLHQSLGCSMAPCTYCGFCERFGCGNYSKASPQTCVLPALMREPNFEARTESEVTKVNLSTRRQDAPLASPMSMLKGEEWEQPADLVLVCAYALFNVRLMLLSGIGKPYDPATARAWSAATMPTRPARASPHSSRTRFNPFIAAGSLGMTIDDYNGDNFDHGPLAFSAAASSPARYTNGAARSRPADAARHAEMGQRSGRRRRRNLSARRQRRRARQRDAATATTISISIRPTRIRSAAR